MEVRATHTGFGVHVEFRLHSRQQLSRWTPAAKTLEELVGRFNSRLSRPSDTLFFRQRQINHHRAPSAVDFARCQACRSPEDARSGETLHRALPNAYLVLIYPVGDTSTVPANRRGTRLRRQTGRSERKATRLHVDVVGSNPTLSAKQKSLE